MLLVLLAILPFLLLTYLLVVKKVSAAKTLLSVYILTVFLLWFFWQASPQLLLAASLKGVVIGFELFLIIIAVLLLFYLLKETGRLDSLKEFFLNYSQDTRIHIVLIGWFFVAFLEGVAGFGTPAAIAAPLLVLLGVQPLLAVIITLMADSAAVVFGAFGTPIVMGVASAVPTADLVAITHTTAVITGVIALFVPLAMLFVHSRYTKQVLTKNYVFFALSAGLLFTIPFVLTAFFIGPELPSVIGSVVGLVTMMVLLRLGFFFGERKVFPPIKPVLGALAPYGLVVALLFFSRANFFGFGDLLRSGGTTIEFTDGVTHVLSAYTPGVLILFAFLVTYACIPDDKSFTAFRKATPALLVLIPTLAFAQLIITSNLTGVMSIPELIASLFTHTSIFYLFFAPLIGAFGAFIAGSATVSNIMFSAVQSSAASATGLSETLVLSLQVVGAAAGNMIAIHNIVAVLAVVHLQEGLPDIIKNNLLVVAGFVLLAALIGFVFLLV